MVHRINVENSGKTTKTPLLIYLSGGVLEATPTYIMALILVTFITAGPYLYFGVIFLSSLLSGVAVSNLFKRHYPDTSISVSVLLGFLAYLFYSLFLFISGISINVNDFLVLVAFVFGGAIGFRIYSSPKEGLEKATNSGTNPV